MSEAKTVDAEQSRWQNAIYRLLVNLSGNDNLDGTGCESGDPLDVTLTEIQLAWNVRENAEFDKQPELAALQKDAERWRKLRNAAAYLIVRGKHLVGDWIAGDRLDAAIDSMEATQQ